MYLVIVMCCTLSFQAEDNISYDKGGSLIRMVHSIVTERSFLKSVLSVASVLKSFFCY